MTEKIHVVLGADSPRTAKIKEDLTTRYGFPIHQAMHGGRPVTESVAYQADAVDPPLPPDCEVWRIECDGPAFAGLKLAKEMWAIYALTRYGGSTHNWADPVCGPRL